MASVGAFLGVIGLFLVTTLVFTVFSFGLPDPNKIVRQQGFSTVIYDRNGKVLYDLYNGENRIPLQLSDIPKYVQEATVSIEDKNFYQHGGFSVTGIARAAFDIVTLQGLSGGSTITQQLVKNVLLSPEQTILRKVREIILANEIEKKFSKDQILQMYLNEIPYGGSAYGIESAAKTYFGKDAKDLDLVESAILAGLPQSPSYYSPLGEHSTAYVDRTRDVLRRMREDGYISAQQESDADKQLPNVKFATISGTINAPHFVFYVRDQLVARFGEQMVESGGLRVTTTLDLDLEQQVEQIVNQEVNKIKYLHATNGAAVAINPQTGEILAMDGSYDYFDKDYGSYNVATALRQPGSSGKPFIYATAFTKGYTPATMLMDVKTSYPSGDPANPNALYTPENYDGKYRGLMQLRFALGNSINTIAVKLTALAGLKDIMTNGYNAGISTWEPTTANMSNVGLSLALGGREVRLLDLTSAYGVFATGGVRNDPVAILKVTDSKGNVLYDYHQVTGRRVFSTGVSFLISHILSDNNARETVFGPVNLLQIPGHTVAVKTGTTDLKRDNWTVGYTPSLVVGVWVGNNDNTVMNQAIASGVTGASPIWNRIMKAALAGKPDQPFQKPDDVVAVTVDALGGGLPHGSDPTRAEYFIKGTEPTAVSPIYKTLKIAKADGKLANDLQVKTGQYDSKEFIVIAEDDPVSASGTNRWQQAIDDWIAANQAGDSRYHPPTDTSTANSDSVSTLIDTPQDHQNLTNNNVEFKARAFSTHDIVNMTLFIDGNQKVSKSTDNLDETICLSNSSHTVKVKGTDSAGNTGETNITIGVNADWNSPAASGSASPCS
ncbi:MAG: PBP1A family penicillin-binding protein [Patescibacteria group bacterium]|nr:PBP1A family penicillin-binding protein [Patescibacteria group bacterium]MCL5432068.1 PBP1A family penicillin-binding protein [Patescibacteria group bacterium]